MSGGGLMQLVAYGAQDVYLTANPQVTFFKQLYRRHSNFAMEAIEQTFNGVANFGKRVTSTIARNGDLIGKTYLQVTLPSISSKELHQYLPSDVAEDYQLGVSWIAFIGQYLVKSVELEIGGQQIDKHYGEWLHIWNELTLPTGKDVAYNAMVNGFGGTAGIVVYKDDTLNGVCEPCEPGSSDQLRLCIASNISNARGCNIEYSIPAPTRSIPSTRELTSSSCIPEHTLYVPLEFWFNRHTGLALPLIALQYHEVKINIEFNELRYLMNVGSEAGVDETVRSKIVNHVNAKGIVAASLYVDYIYLDTEERRRFAQVAHEYLIEQLQFTGEESVTSSSNKIRMSFNHPVKELVWVVQNPYVIDCTSNHNYPHVYSDNNDSNPVVTAKLQLNGHDRFSEREGFYFNTVQPYQHHTNTPNAGINIYSFALKPEDHQPSGTCNMSRIDNATLNLTLTPAVLRDYADSDVASSASVRIYAVNYNVLRIMSGMGGLAYSN